MKENTIRVPQRVEVKGRYLTAFQSGNLAQNLIFMFISSMITYYYTQVVGLSAILAGSIFMVATILDAVIDPLVGMIMEKTNTKHGRYVPYLVIFGPLTILIFVAMFMVPAVDTRTQIIYSYTTYLMFCMSRSFVQIGFQALATLSSGNIKRRQMYMIVRNVFGRVAALLVTVLLVPLLNLLGGRENQSSWNIALIIYATICLISYFFCILGARKFDLPDKVLKVEDLSEEELKIYKTKPLTFKNQLHAFITNVPLLLLIIGFSTDMFANIIQQQTNLYFFDFNLGGRDALFSIINLLKTIVGIIPFIVGPFVLAKFSKRNLIICFESICIVLCLAYWFAGDQNITMLYVNSIGIAFCAGFIAMASWMCVPDCADYSEWKKDIRVAGLSSAAVGLSNQLMQAIAGLLLGAILQAVGFISQSATQSQAVMDAIFAMRMWFPIVAFVITILAMLFYPINKKVEKQMEAELTQRRQQRLHATN